MSYLFHTFKFSYLFHKKTYSICSDRFYIWIFCLYIREVNITVIKRKYYYCYNKVFIFKLNYILGDSKRTTRMEDST